MLEAMIWVTPCDNGYLLSYREPSQSGIGAERRRFFLDKGELLSFLAEHWPTSAPETKRGSSILPPHDGRHLPGV